MAIYKIRHSQSPKNAFFSIQRTESIYQERFLLNIQIRFFNCPDPQIRSILPSDYILKSKCHLFSILLLTLQQAHSNKSAVRQTEYPHLHPDTVLRSLL